MEVLSVKYIDNFRDALTLRKIRNECREFMTRDRSKISLLQQFQWYYNTYKMASPDDWLAFLFYVGDEPAGYGVVRDKGTKPLISGGLAKKFRGKGFGEQMFMNITNVASSTAWGKGYKSVYLEVLETNTIALRLYHKLGYVEASRANGVISMQKDYGEFD